MSKALTQNLIDLNFISNAMLQDITNKNKIIQKGLGDCDKCKTIIIKK